MLPTILLTAGQISHSGRNIVYPNQCLLKETFTFESNNSTILIPNANLECGKWVTVNYEAKLYSREMINKIKVDIL